MPTLDPALGLVLVLAYAALLLPAAWHKVRDLAVFRAVLEAYRLVPRILLGPMSVLLPLAEAGLAVGLLVPASRPVCAVATAVLLLVYAFAIGWNVAHGRTDLDCGCTGPLERRPVAGWMVTRNVILALTALLTALPWDSRTLGWLDLYSIIAALATILLLWLAIDRLYAQVMPRGALLKVSR
jgi:uncharacterized membrane protein YphA (DoxX/SURF4 family)